MLKEAQIENHKTKNLSSNSIYALFVDNQGNLWTWGSAGINYLEINSPFRILDKTFGLNGVQMSAARNYGDLYLATDEYLYRSDFSPKLSFDRIDFPSNVVRNLVKTETGLLRTHLDFPFFINKLNNIEKIKIPKGSPKTLLPINKNKVLVGTGDGEIYLSNLEKKNYQKFLDIALSINDLFITENNQLWISTRTNGIFLLDNLNSYLEKTANINDKLSDYPTKASALSFFTEIDNQLYYGNNSGLFSYNIIKDSFENVNHLFNIPDSSFLCNPINSILILA